MHCLSEQERRFCDEFILDRCGEKAARRAGFEGAGQQLVERAARMLATPEIWEEIKRRQIGQASRYQERIGDILRLQEQIAFVDPLEFFHADGTPKALKEIPKKWRRTVEGFETKTNRQGVMTTTLKLASRQVALSELARACLLDAPELPIDPPRMEKPPVLGVFSKMIAESNSRMSELIDVFDSSGNSGDQDANREARQLRFEYERFCREFIKDHDPLKAFRRAGLEGVNEQAHRHASELDQHPALENYIYMLEAQKALESPWHLGKIEQALWRIAYADPLDWHDDQGNVKPITELPQSVRMTIVFVRVTLEPGREAVWAYRFGNKKAALRSLAELAHVQKATSLSTESRLVIDPDIFDTEKQLAKFQKYVEEACEEAARKRSELQQMKN